LALAGLIVFLMLRPDPLLHLTQTLPDEHSATPGRRRGRIRLILAELGTNRKARYALVAILTAQVVMVSIMTMTPVHIAHQGESVTVVGITISLHIAGMYALAPVVGILADRRGPRQAIAIGIVIFLLALLSGAIYPDDTGWI